MNNSKCKTKFMAFKVDTEKAYGKISWNFLHHTLSNLGFDYFFVSKIKYCVTSHSYHILVNGVPSNVVSPSRGLTQGGPLSPYLYVLCGEALLQTLLTKAKYVRSNFFSKNQFGRYFCSYFAICRWYTFLFQN